MKVTNALTFLPNYDNNIIQQLRYSGGGSSNLLMEQWIFWLEMPPVFLQKESDSNSALLNPTTSMYNTTFPDPV